MDSGIPDSGWPWFDRMRDRYIAENGFAAEEPELSDQEKRAQHFAQYWHPRLPRLAVATIDEIWPNGVFSGSRPRVDVSEALMRVYPWRLGDGNRLICARTGRGKTVALTYCGLRAMGDPVWPEAAEYLTCDVVERDRWAPTDDMVRAPLLLIDELEKLIKTKPWKRAELYALINERTRNDLTIISATNAPVDELRDALGDEWIDRLGVGDQILEVREMKNWRQG